MTTEQTRPDGRALRRLSAQRLVRTTSGGNLSGGESGGALTLRVGGEESHSSPNNSPRLADGSGEGREANIVLLSLLKEVKLIRLDQKEMKETYPQALGQIRGEIDLIKERMGTIPTLEDIQGIQLVAPDAEPGHETCCCCFWLQEYRAL